MKKNMKKGFTLIEMMIVVAIIAVLAGVAVPQYGKYIKKSETVEGVTLMRQILDAEVLYHTTNNAYLPLNTQTGTDKADKLQAKLYVTLPDGAKFANYKVEVCTPTNAGSTDNGLMVTSWTGTTADATDLKEAIYMVFPKRSGESSFIENYVNGTTNDAPACE